MLPPIFYHYFAHPLPYARTLALQEAIHALQLERRRSNPGSHQDILLLLQHRPVYTAGRRQTDESVRPERERLTASGADFETTERGGQLTYHGPGQIVGYPLIDLYRSAPSESPSPSPSIWPMSTRDYVCRLQKTLERFLLKQHGIASISSEHTGVFTNPNTKIGSIGVQVRHRLTSHGFALNVTNEPLPWFSQIVACGLDTVQAGSIESEILQSESTALPQVDEQIPSLVSEFGDVFQRDMLPFEFLESEEISTAMRDLEEESLKAGDWPRKPRV
jgi:lipoyl(octanoyl) transferase 2